MEDELPKAYRLVAELLGSREVAFHVGDERLFLRATPPRLRIAFEGIAPSVDLRASRSIILALADGRLTLLDAVISGDLFLRGTSEDLIAFHDALTAYLKGAMRCAGFAELRDDYLREPASTVRHSTAVSSPPGGAHAN